MTDKPPPQPKAYENQDFLHSRDGRALRILSEYHEPLSRLAHYNVTDTVVFMGSARLPSAEAAAEALAAAARGEGNLATAQKMEKMSVYYEAARELAHRLTEWSKGLGDEERRFVVCTGGGPGIMEAANRGASEAKGLNVGLTISLPFEEFENPYISRELAFHFHYFFMRKFWFLYLAKGMIFFPGGFGTLDELFETLTLVQTHKMRKQMPMVLFGKSFWDKVINLDALVEAGTISAEDLDLLFHTDSVDEAFEHITTGLMEHAIDRPGPTL
ncbi:MAG: hypothetical protein ACI9MJ_001070 [Alphaproteobacteria bacterium]|jgi:uncharacterized protein (TIGR00730 family)